MVASFTVPITLKAKGVVISFVVFVIYASSSFNVLIFLGKINVSHWVTLEYTKKGAAPFVVCVTISVESDVTSER